MNFKIGLLILFLLPLNLSAIKSKKKESNEVSNKINTQKEIKNTSKKSNKKKQKIKIDETSPLLQMKNSMKEQIKQAINQQITKGGYVIVLKDKRKLIEINEVFHSRSILPVASLSKAMTAISILKLRQEGYLNLTEPVSQYLPELFTSTDEIGYNSKITIKNLLHHNSGIPYDGKKSGLIFEVNNREFILPEITTPVGEKYIYSNYNYRLLAKIIEKVSGMSPAKFLEENLFVPIEISEYNLENYEGASGVSISPRQLMKYMSIYLNQGVFKDKRILHKKNMKKIFSRPDQYEHSNYYGLGWHILANPNTKKIKTLFHSGIGDYSYCQVRIFTDTGYSFYFITESTGKNRVQFNKLNKNLETILHKFISTHQKIELEKSN
jgi:hypothetical protein